MFNADWLRKLYSRLNNKQRSWINESEDEDAVEARWFEAIIECVAPENCKEHMEALEKIVNKLAGKENANSAFNPLNREVVKKIWDEKCKVVIDNDYLYEIEGDDYYLEYNVVAEDVWDLINKQIGKAIYVSSVGITNYKLLWTYPEDNVLYVESNGKEGLVLLDSGMYVFWE